MFGIAQGTPVITLGTHEIKGRIMSLKKPYMVIRKGIVSTDDSNSMEYEIAGVVTKKVLFDDRPKTIMRY